MHLEPGTRIGPYEIAALIGEGGMGEVYRAHDERLQRDVAVKLMSEDASGDAEHMRRMQREARAAGQLSHPNILAVFDVGVYQDRMYVVSELLSGEALSEIIRRGPTPWRSAHALALQMAEGLAIAHEHGVVHRDIKPDNIFLTKDKRIKILDFGVATQRGTGALASAHASTISQAGLLIGTVGYMSPEQARAQQVDQRSDIFAFGCVLYELLTAKRAFTAPTPLEILVAIERDTPAPIQDVAPDVPADLIRIVERCLEKDAAHRFQSSRDLLFALTLVQVTGVSVDKLVTPVKKPARKFTLPGRTTVYVILALLVGVIVASTFRCTVKEAKEPVFYRQITFRRGTVYTARFTLDGAGMIYSAAWDGNPRELFASVSGSRESRPMNQPETDAAFLLSTGELGLIRRSRRGFSPGVLARMPLAGGPSKDMFDSVRWADSSPDGTDIVIIRANGSKQVLEMPPEHPLVEAALLAYPRLSPDKQHVAYLEYVDYLDDSGRLVIVDRNGVKKVETGIWKSIEGLAWRNNSEIWFGASKEGRSLWLHALDMGGQTRILCRAPGRLVLHDLFSDGRVLAERNSYRATLMVGTSAEGQDKDMSWQDYSQLGQLSRDGKQMLFTEEGDGAGAGSTVYLRSLEGGVPLRLGEGFGLALSADAQKALIRVGKESVHLEVVPIGSGTTTSLPIGPLTSVAWAAFTPDNSKLVLWGHEADKVRRLYVQDLPSGLPRRLTEDEVEARGDAVSPDGSVVAAFRKGKAILVPLDGSAARELPGLENRIPIGFTSDGRTLFVRDKDPLPLKISRYELQSGKLEPWRTFAPTDAAGMLSIGRVSLARDGEVHVYESYRLLSDLYVIENIE